MLNRSSFGMCCSQLVSLAGEYKQYCRNSDQLVCIEMCAKMCHFCCFCAMTDQLDESMLSKLKDVCSWCNDVCETIGFNQGRQCCDKFHECCTQIVEMSSQTPLYRGENNGDLDHESLDALGKSCQALYCKGVVEKPSALLNKSLDPKQLSQVEACIKLCSCITFMCMNVRSHVDRELVKCCMRFCQNCIDCECCSEEARACSMACTECLQRLSTKTSYDTTNASPIVREATPSDLSGLIESLLGSNSYRT